MNDLRIIIFALGLLLIGIIYFWETIRTRKKSRKEKRKETVSLQDAEHDEVMPHIHISKDSAEPDLSVAISELNETLAENRRYDEDLASDIITDVANMENNPSAGDHRNVGSSNQTASHEQAGNKTSSSGDDYKNVNPEQIISLFVTSSEDSSFSGNDILDAINEIGMEYGDMDIFHHFGIGEYPLDRPIFSLADMYKPGSFNIDNMASHATRGLSLFMCLPLPIDQQIVFELMLNTAQRLAELLDGDIRASNHEVLNDQHIAEIRDSIS